MLDSKPSDSALDDNGDGDAQMPGADSDGGVPIAVAQPDQPVAAAIAQPASLLRDSPLPSRAEAKDQSPVDSQLAGAGALPSPMDNSDDGVLPTRSTVSTRAFKKEPFVVDRIITVVVRQIDD